MSGPTHVMSSGILGLSLCYKFGVSPVYAGICILGGLFPDTDTRKSMLGRFVWLWLVFRPHRRNLLHSLAGAIFISGMWMFKDATAAVYFLMGYLSHLALDMLNPTGVRLLWPKPDMFRLASLKSGGLSEIPVLFLWYIAAVALLSL